MPDNRGGWGIEVSLEDRTSGNQQLNKSRGSGLGNSRLVVVVVELVTVEWDEVAAGDVVVINITARNVHL